MKITKWIEGIIAKLYKSKKEREKEEAIERENEEKEKWKVKKEYLNMVSELEAKFILEHAEKQLKDSLDTNTIITTKTTSLITLAVGILVALFGFTINRWDKSPVMDALFTTSVIACIYVFKAVTILASIIHPISYYIPGSLPSEFFCENFFVSSLPEKHRQKAFYINEIEEYYFRITKNDKTNRKRGKLFKTSLYMLISSPIVFIVIYLFLVLVA